MIFRFLLQANQNGGEGKCLYIDSHNSFRTTRINSMCQRFEMSEELLLTNICVGRAHNSDHLLALIKESGQILSESKYSLIIVDSIFGHFRSDYAGRAELYERQKHLAEALQKLKQLADQFGVAVVYTNQVLANVDSFIGFQGREKPTGGNIMAHASKNRLWLRRGRSEQRICRLVNSPNLSTGEAPFKITTIGIEDVL